jgi:hypothetical protein
MTSSSQSLFELLPIDEVELDLKNHRIAKWLEMYGDSPTADQILAAIGVDVERMAQKVADAINHAEAGAIIDQSEEQVRDAHAELRQQTYQKALSLLEKNQQAFSPSAELSPTEMEK